MQHSENTGLENHDEMQDAPFKETGSTSPTVTSHNALGTSVDMQLPLGALAQASCVEPVFDNGNQEGQSLDLPASGANGVSHQSQTVVFCPDSLSVPVTQPNLGQDHTETWANKTQNELLLERIKLCKEKQLQLAKLQSEFERFVQTGSLVPGDHVHSASTNTRAEPSDNPCVTNAEYMKQNVSNELAAVNTLEVLYSDVDLDVNSNMSVRSPEAVSTPDLTGNIEKSQSVRDVHASGLKQTSKCTKTELDRGSNIAPCLLRNTFSKGESYQDSVDKETVSSQQPVALELTAEQTDATENTKQFEHSKSISSTLGDIVTPLWTPLALKSVAKHQKELTRSDDISQKLNEPPQSKTLESCTDRQVLSENTFHEISSEDFSKNGTGLKTPPPCKELSAFRKLGRTGLTPVMGSMSLRANIDTKKISQMEEKCKSYPTGQVLQAANERYLQALLDNEVELFTSRLVFKQTSAIRCYNPVAKVLLEGDDMVSIRNCGRQWKLGSCLYCSSVSDWMMSVKGWTNV